jgi:hypothetical protein
MLVSGTLTDNQSLDKLQLTGQNLGRVFNSGISCAPAMQLPCFEINQLKAMFPLAKFSAITQVTCDRCWIIYILMSRCLRGSRASKYSVADIFANVHDP